MSNLDERSGLDRDQLEVDGEADLDIFDDDSLERGDAAAESSSERARGVTAAHSERALDVERSLRERRAEARRQIEQMREARDLEMELHDELVGSSAARSGHRRLTARARSARF